MRRETALFAVSVHRGACYSAVRYVNLHAPRTGHGPNKRRAYSPVNGVYYEIKIMTINSEEKINTHYLPYKILYQI